MKKLFLILILAFAVSCEPKEKVDDFKNPAYECERPSDIPDTLSDGTEVYWDCDWYSSYKNGDVFVIYNENGAATTIGRRLTPNLGDYTTKE